MRTKHAGFSRNEFLIVILMITCMILISIPFFFMLRNNARESQMEETVAKLRAGIAAWHYRKLVDENSDAYPDSLDLNAEQAPCTQCFERVMEQGISNSLWFKIGPTEYLFSRDGDTSSPESYQEKKDFKLNYNPVTGALFITQNQ